MRILLVSVFCSSCVVDAFEEANDITASECSENQDYEYFLCVAVYLYVPIFWCLDAHGDRKLITTVTLACC